jgi:hypothetical protein
MTLQRERLWNVAAAAAAAAAAAENEARKEAVVRECLLVPWMAPAATILLILRFVRFVLSSSSFIAIRVAKCRIDHFTFISLPSLGLCAKRKLETIGPLVSVCVHLATLITASEASCCRALHGRPPLSSAFSLHK